MFLDCSEDTSNFLFTCPIYAAKGAALSVIHNLQKSNLNYLGNHLKFYLYGDDSISLKYNRLLYLFYQLKIKFYLYFTLILIFFKLVFFIT